MKVSCPACDSKYTIADEKVAGRKVKVRCKSCGGQILINGTIPPPAPDASVGDAESEKGNSNAPRAISPSSAPPGKASGSHARSERPSAPLAQVDDGITWSVNVTETDERSLKTHEVVAGYLSGEFSGEVYVWHDGMTDWATIPDVPQLAAAVAQAQQVESQTSTKPARALDEQLHANVDTTLAAKQKVLPSLAKGGKPNEPLTSIASPAVAGKKSAARVTGAKRPENAHDLFAAASAAGSEMDVPVSEEDEEVQKRTGARNENSVLFSLDALKAGITASPAPTASKGVGGKKAPATPRKKIEDIMGTAAGPIAVGPGATLLNANQALLTAPAPPPPPPPKPEPVIAADGGAAATAAAINFAREKEKTKRLIIGSVAAILVVGGIAGIAIAMTKRSEPAPIASSKTTAAAAPTPEPVKATPPPTAEEPKPAESAAASAAVPSAPKAAGVGAGSVKTGGGAVVANAGPKPEPKKETKKEEPSGPISSGAASFNKEAAGQALAVAASQTSICKKPDGPTGQGKVQVTFAPSGRATTANIVSGPFGGTAVGGCVSGVFKRARVPAFTGDPVTVAKSFSITP